ncbi:MAG: MotA/TolQ/ExbB proton channel family protein [Myxococcota bacterium]|nr:MotA/TolQ/ExbB proton channel family protein [Myxococcota bacterium]
MRDLIERCLDALAGTGFVGLPLIFCAALLGYALCWRLMLVMSGRVGGSSEALHSVCAAAAAVAPLLGLLGTVTGMIETFDSLGEMAMHTQGGGIAGGISEALLSTQLGLCVAIPGLTLDRLLLRVEARFMRENEGLSHGTT